MLNNCKRLLRMEEDKLVSLIPIDFNDEGSVRLFFSERCKTIEACGYMVRSLCKVQHIPPIDIRDAVRDIRNIALKLMEDLDESMYKDRDAMLQQQRITIPIFSATEPKCIWEL